MLFAHWSYYFLHRQSCLIPKVSRPHQHSLFPLNFRPVLCTSSVGAYLRFELSGWWIYDSGRMVTEDVPKVVPMIVISSLVGMVSQGLPLLPWHPASAKYFSIRWVSFHVVDSEDLDSEDLDSVQAGSLVLAVCQLLTSGHPLDLRTWSDVVRVNFVYPYDVFS